MKSLSIHSLSSVPGYGHMVPITPIGKIVTMIYAVIGVPLFLLYLSNIGEIFATSFKWTYSRLCKCQLLRGRGRRQYRVEALPNAIHGLDEQGSRVTASEGSIESSICSGEEEDDYDVEVDENKPESLNRVSVPISLSLTVMISYICGGAILFGELEKWDFLDGSYFCFITLTTIGFGDMVPGDAVGDGEGDDVIAYLPGINLQFIFCSLYIIFGMAVIAMCFSLMQEKTVRGVLALGRKIGVIKTEPGG